ncbi:MAG: citrate/2-methylcitrate synthase [Chloroflexota bacterium]
MTTSVMGMEDIVAAQSAITWIDGRAGELRYRGYSVSELVENCSYESVAYLLWHGELPSETQLDSLRDPLRADRVARADLLGGISALPRTAHPLDVLRYLVSADALRNPLTWENSREANLRKAIEFTAWFPVATAAYHRVRAGKEPVAPRPDLDTAANFLYMLNGAEASATAVRTLDTSLILHADHELNASTFAARVTIATESNLHAAIASALGTLTGPRHGGASERVIRMLEEIGQPDRAEAYVRGELDAKRRIMGYGHRMYRTADPRSRYLRVMAEKMLAGTERENWTAILAALSTIMEREKNLYPNVDLYAAVVNHELGIDPAFYTAVFAVSRIAGWTAHAMEQFGGRMIRPAAEYIGPAPRSLTAP